MPPFPERDAHWLISSHIHMAERHLTEPKLGSGKRFEHLEGSLEHKGIRNPAALAAAIGRKKYGKKKFTKLGEEGKKRDEEK